MAGEIQVSYVTGKTLYSIIRNKVGLVWNTGTNLFEPYASGSYANYVVVLVEQGSSSGFYVGTFPSAITPGVYSLVGKLQAGGSPVETDGSVASGDEQWSGVFTLGLSDVASSGQLAQVGQGIRLTRSKMIQNFSFKLTSSIDHITPFVSGVVSGQISRDGAAFTNLQSGLFAEVGHGWYAVQALTSGDLNANVVSLIFTANGISGGTSDQRDLGIVLQPSSGYQ